MNTHDLLAPLQPLIQNWSLLLGGRYPQELWPRPLLTCATIFLSICLLTTAKISLRWKLFFGPFSLLAINTIYLGTDFLGGIFAPVQSGQVGGFSLTLYLFYHAVLLSIIPGILLALGRHSKLKSLQFICATYVEVIRGVPLLTLLFVGHFLFPYLIPPNSTPLSEIQRLVLCYVMFSAAYSAEIWRGAFLTVPTGMREAAHSLGLNPFQTFTLVSVPVAFRNALPGLLSNAIGLLKDSSLVATLGVFDLLGVARLIPRQPEWLGHSIVPLLFVCLVYLVLGYALSQRLKYLEPKWST